MSSCTSDPGSPRRNVRFADSVRIAGTGACARTVGYVPL